MSNPIFECHNYTTKAQRAILFNKYSEPFRKYHNNDHITKMWNYYQWTTPNYKWDERTKLAIVFHDCEYVVGDPNNELNSANVFADMLGLDLNKKDSVFNDVYEAILATKDHLNPIYDTYPDWIQMFIDIDLYELGSEEAVYCENGKKILEEFSCKYTEQEILAGRAKWIETFLAHDRIFRVFKNREKQARLNLNNELSKLKEKIDE